MSTIYEISIPLNKEMFYTFNEPDDIVKQFKTHSILQDIITIRKAKDLSYTCDKVLIQKGKEHDNVSLLVTNKPTSVPHNIKQEYATSILLRMKWIKDNLHLFQGTPVAFFGFNAWPASHDKSKMKGEFIVYDPWKISGLFRENSDLKKRQEYELYTLPYCLDTILPAQCAIFIES